MSRCGSMTGCRTTSATRSPTAARKTSAISCAAALAKGELFGRSSAPRPHRTCGFVPRSGSRWCFAAELDVHGVRSEVGTVWPADGAIFIDRDLAEHCLIAQRLEHFPDEFARKVDRALDAVVKFD